MRYEIEHVSRYLYTAPVQRCVMSLCLQPRDDRGQRLLHFAVSTAPSVLLNDETDSFGNTKHILNVHQEHEVLEVTTHTTVETAPVAALPGSLGAGAWEELRSWGQSLTHWDFMHASAFARPSAALMAFMERLGIEPDGDPLASLLRLSDTLYDSFQYVPGVTSAVSPIEHILETGRGVCQDYAHVMIAIARSWGVPARYVSGYMYVTHQAPGNGYPRLGRVPVAGPRLDRLRSHQPEPRRRAVRAHRGGAGLSGCGADPGHPAGRRRQPAGG